MVASNLDNDKLKWDRRFLGLAKHVASWSKDPSTKVGSVIADGKKIVSLGYNGFPSGIKDWKYRYEDRDWKLEHVLHAEENAIHEARGRTDGNTIYTFPVCPCYKCSSHIIQCGLTRVVSMKNERDEWLYRTAMLYKEAGVELILYPEDFLDYED